jgi:drug/metabolite transporter (DMT)-like permease
MILLTIAPRMAPAAEVGLIMLVETVLGPLWVWLGIGEEPSVQTLVGGAVVLLTLTGHTILGPEINQGEQTRLT